MSEWRRSEQASRMSKASQQRQVVLKARGIAPKALWYKEDCLGNHETIAHAVGQAGTQMKHLCSAF